MALIQQTQKRRGLPLIAAGFELQSTLKGWESATKAIPDEYLSRSYEHAVGNWPWTERKGFEADAIADAYKILVVEDKQRAEATKRNAARQNPDTYRCWHCQDVGYQSVFTYQNKLWYVALRPCYCEAAPVEQRQEFRLSETDFVRDGVGNYARLVDIEKYGYPTEAFKASIDALAKR